MEITTQEQNENAHRLLAEIKQEITMLSMRYYNNSPVTRKEYKSKAEYDKAHAAATTRIRELKAQSAALKRAIDNYKRLKRASRKYDARTNNKAIATQARLMIESLIEQLGDEWTHEQRIVCRLLRNAEKYGIDQSGAVADLQEQIKVLQIENARHMQVITQLSQALSDAQKRPTLGREIWQKIYARRYDEVDEWRRANGFTHRIHLTAQDCQDIEGIL